MSSVAHDVETLTSLLTTRRRTPSFALLKKAGEAAKRVPEAIRVAHPTVPWRSLAGMRDKLIHDSIGVNTEVVWRTVVDEVPPVLRALAAIGSSSDKTDPA